MNTLKRFRVGSAAALLSLSLHGLILVPALLAGSGRGPVRASHASVRGSEAEPALTWVAIGVPSQPSIPSLEALRLSIRMLSPRVQVPAALPLDLNSSLDTAAPQDAADNPVLAYIWRMGALTARIQSVWTLPRDRLAADFHCEVRIRRGDTGAVEEVELETCDEVESVRESLVRAIERAAPLPPLNDEHHAGADITLRFAAYAAPTDGRHTAVEPGAATP